MNGLQGGHLTPEELFEFIDQGGGSGPAGHHLPLFHPCITGLSVAGPRRGLNDFEMKPLTELHHAGSRHDCAGRLRSMPLLADDFSKIRICLR